MQIDTLKNDRIRQKHIEMLEADQIIRNYRKNTDTIIKNK